MSTADKKERKKPKNTEEPMQLLTPEIKEELNKHVGKHVSELNKDGGVFREMTKQMLEYLMDQEIAGKLGYEKHEFTGRGSGNARNGHNKKTVKSIHGEFELETPRDRNGDYEPKIVKKYQTDVSMFDDTIISMYAKGMTVRDIQEQIKQMWGIDMSPSSISNVTNQVVDFANPIQWRHRVQGRLHLSRHRR